MKIRIELPVPTTGPSVSVSAKVPEDATTLRELSKTAERTAYVYVNGDKTRVGDPIWSLFHILSLAAEVSASVAKSKADLAKQTAGKETTDV